MIKEIFDVKLQYQRQGIEGLALDIDETLSATLPLWFKLMQEKFGNPENLSTKEMIAKYKYFKNVPYWQNDQIKDFAQELRDSNEIQTQLEVLKEADKYIQKLIQICPITAYITARPQSIVPGTQKWLDMHNFPKAPIIAKPEYIMLEKVNVWKAEVLDFLYPQVLGIIDDNADILNFINKDYKGFIFLYNNLPQEIQTSQKNVIVCPDWESVLAQVKDIKTD